MDKKQIFSLISSVVEISNQASHAIRSVYLDGDLQVQLKPDYSPVTLADERSHQIIRQGLQKLTPDIPVLSEEGKSIDFSQRKSWDKLWLVDPLDGTKEFIEQTGEYTINIALVVNNNPILGVVTVPEANHCYWGSIYSSAYWQDGDNQPVVIKTKPNKQLLRVLVSRRHGKQDKLDSYLANLGKHELKICGSTLKICLIAKGDADLYPRFGNTYEWDTAAGQCILEAAGGNIISLNNQPLKYNATESLLNPEFIAVADRNLVNCG